MGEPNISVNYSGRRFGSVEVLRGQLLVPADNDTSYYLPATDENCAGRRAEAISLETLGDGQRGSIAIRQTGTITAELSGLEPYEGGSWCRRSSDGYIERCTPEDGDDIVGYADEDGRVHLTFGYLTAEILYGSATANDIIRSDGTTIDTVAGFNGTALETTDTPGVGEVWTYREVDGKYRSAKPSPWVNVKDYGATGDGVTDDTAAIQLAVAAVKATALAIGTGARLHFPAGVYLCSEMLDFDSYDIDHRYQSITLYGDGGGLTATWRATSTLIYTGSDARAFISARSSLGFSIQSMAILYNNGEFEGSVVDFSHGPMGWDALHMTTRDVVLSSDSVMHMSAANLILLDGAHCGVFDNCTLYGAVAGIRGCSGAGYSVEYPSGQTNRHLITGCNFDRCSLAAIVNPAGQSWVVSSNTFAGIAMPRVIACDTNSIATCGGFRFEGNWIGDCAEAFDAIPAIDNNGWLAFYGASFDANFFGHNIEKVSLVLGPSFGVSVTANVIGTIDFSLIPGVGSYPQGVTVTGNYLQGNNAEANPWFKGISVYAGGLQSIVQTSRVHIAGNNSPNYGSLDHRIMSGHLVTIPSLFTQPTVLGVTNIAATVDGSIHKGSNDIAGRITLVSTGGGGAAGTQCTLTFAHGYDASTGTKPKVILMSENEAAATVAGGVYVVPDFTDFEIVAPSGLPAETYVWAYHVIG